MKDIGRMMGVVFLFMSIYYLILFFRIEKCINAIKRTEKKSDSIRPNCQESLTTAKEIKMSETDRRNPIFYYEIKGLGGMCLNTEGLEMTEGAGYEDAAKELFDALSKSVRILRGKTYRVLTEKEYQEEYGD